MSDTILVSTRKGLFTLERTPSGWDIAKVDFLGDNVTLAAADPRDGRRYAALDHGHFGVKLHRSTDNGWEEIAAPGGVVVLDDYGDPAWAGVKEAADAYLATGRSRFELLGRVSTSAFLRAAR